MYNGLRFYLHAITEHLVSTQECRIIGGGRTMVAYSTSLYEWPTLLQCNQRKAGQFQEKTEGDVRLHT